MTMLRYPYEPNHLEGYPPLIEDLFELRDNGQIDALQAIAAMVKDLRQHGTQSRFLKTMKGLPILELKTRARGGEKGGARVYLYRADTDEFHLCAAEGKAGNQPTQALLERTALIAVAWHKNLEIFPSQHHKRQRRQP
jgi:hypothetical protein